MSLGLLNRYMSHVWYARKDGCNLWLFQMVLRLRAGSVECISRHTVHTALM